MNQKIYVGTSGWFYGWNPEQSLDWYVKNSKLNSIELNASFYRFPFPNQVKAWAKKGSKLRWAVKVNRLITHTFKFSDRAFQIWKKFEKLFAPLDKNIDFYLFQLHPILTPKFKPKLEKFIKKTKLGRRFALEVRNKKWFENIDESISWAKKLGITWVSIDAPEFSKDVYNTSGVVYERIHGRTFWYSHNYSERELKEISKKIKATKPKKVYVYFNNNHNMLENARNMRRILSK